MLVKARFLRKVPQEGELDHRYLFLLSAQDARLLAPHDRPLATTSWPPGLPTRGIVLQSGHVGAQGGEQLPLEEMTRLFVADLPFAPDIDTGTPPGTQREQVAALVPGSWHWLMIEGTFGWLRHANDGVVLAMDDLRGARLLRVYCAGIYPWFPADDYEAVVAARASEHGVVNPQPLARLAADGLPSTNDNADWLVRAVGAVLSLPITPAIIQEGIQLHGGNTRRPLADGLTRLYSLWQKATPQKARARPRVGPPPPPPPHELRGQPLIEIVTDLSNPEEYGSPGAMLLAQVASSPYRWVGISGSPGSGMLREGGGASHMFPFWAMDLLAHALAGRMGGNNEILADERSMAVATETFRQLEHRNIRAFLFYDEFGRTKGSSSFDFDWLQGGVPFLSPAGSTVFAESVVASGLARRTQDLNRPVQHPDAIVYFGDSRWPSPWTAYAGFLGIRLQPLRQLQHQAGREKAITAVASPALHPLQAETPTDATTDYRFLQLSWRQRLEERIAARALAQSEQTSQPHHFDLHPNTDATMLPGVLMPAHPIVWRPSIDIPPGREAVTPSQGEALRRIARGYMTAVTGRPGTGKTHLLRELWRIVREVTSDQGWLLVLTPTNRTAARVCERLSDIARDGEPLVLGGKGHDKAKGQFGIAVGTIDAFLARMQHVRLFAHSILSRDGILVIDECGMVTAERFVSVLSRIDPPASQRSPTQNGRLLRIVLGGDHYQLESVEPGNFFLDVMRGLAVTDLREPVRTMAAGIAGNAANDETGLEPFFGLVRASMDREELRYTVVRYLLAHVHGTTPTTTEGRESNEAAGIDSRQFEPFGLPNPTAGGSTAIRATVVDDLPSRQPETREAYTLFLSTLEDQVRNAVFRTILRYRGVQLSLTKVDDAATAPILPAIPMTADAAIKQAAALDFHRIRTAVTAREPAVKIVALYRTPRSMTGETTYISSSSRINRWFVDFLTGQLPRPPGYWRPSINQAPVRPPDTEADDDPDREHLQLVDGWPYQVRRNDFRPFGIFRGERVTLLGCTGGRNTVLYRFLSESGRQMAIPPRWCQPRYLTYGWATNVHQVQGAEYPLIIFVWIEGVPWGGPGGIQQAWPHVWPGATKTDRFRRGVRPVNAPGEDGRLDLRRFYTGITRTMALWRSSDRRTAQGQCAIITGYHALRLYLGIETLQRATGFAGILQPPEK